MSIDGSCVGLEIELVFWNIKVKFVHALEPELHEIQDVTAAPNEKEFHSSIVQ